MYSRCFSMSAATLNQEVVATWNNKHIKRNRQLSAHCASWHIYSWRSERRHTNTSAESTILFAQRRSVLFRPETINVLLRCLFLSEGQKCQDKCLSHSHARALFSTRLNHSGHPDDPPAGHCKWRCLASEVFVLLFPAPQMFCSNRNILVKDGWGAGLHLFS